MSTSRPVAAKITIRKVEPGEARYGCDPRAVQVLFVESQTLQNKPNMAYLNELFEKNGFQTREVEGVKDVPFLRLCVFRQGEKGLESVTVDEVVAVLKSDPDEIDLTEARITGTDQSS